MSNTQPLRPALRPAIFAVAGIILIALLATAIWLLGSRLVPSPSLPIIGETFGLIPAALGAVVPKPVETLTYALTLIFGVPVLVGLAYVTARTEKYHPPAWVTPVVIAGTLAGTALLCSQLAWQNFAPQPPLESVLVSALKHYAHPLRLLLESIAVVAIVVLYGHTGQRRNPIAAAVLCIILLVEAWLASLIVTNTNEPFILTSTHYEIFTYPIVQDYLGVELLKDQPTQYGLYPLFLRPLWHFWMKPTPFVITVTMAALLAASMAMFTWFLFRFFSNKTFGALTALCGLAFSMFWYPMWPGDMYLQFFPLRLVFPALACLFASAPMPERKGQRFALWLIGYITVGFGIFWNPEAGVVAVLGLVAFWTLTTCGGKTLRAFARASFTHGGLALGGAAFAFLCINAYYMARFGNMPPWSEFVYHIRLFSAGYYAIPMEHNGVWIIYAIVYALIIFDGARRWLEGHDVATTQKSAAMLMIGVIGCLLFKYYAGRSHPVVLSWVSFPVIFSAGFLLDGAWTEARSTAARWSVRGMVGAAILCIGCVVGGLDSYARNREWPRPSSVWLHPSDAPTAFDQKLDTIIETSREEAHGEAKKLLVLAPYASLTYLRLDQASPLLVDAMCQMIFQKDHARIRAEIDNPETALVVVDNVNPTCTFILPNELIEPDRFLEQKGYVAVHPPALAEYPTLHLYARKSWKLSDY